MCAAAKLGREVAHLDHADCLAVLFAEECHCAFLAGCVNIGFLCNYLVRREDVRVYESLYLLQLVGSERGEVSEVKTASFVVHI